MENNIKRAVNTLEREAENVRGKMGEDIAESGRETWRELRERGRTLWNQTREQSEEAMKEAQAMVRRYPARTLGAALLAGAIVGFLIAYRSED